MRYMSLNPNDEEIILATLRTYPEFMNADFFNLALISKKKPSSESKVEAF
jgi:ATP-dependent DNA helicase RecQ